MKGEIMKNLNKLALVSFVIGLIYFIFLIANFIGSSTTTTGSEQAGALIATALVMPHMITEGVAMIFNGLGTFLNKRAFILVGAILYAVSMVLFPLYFMFVVVEMILSFIAYAKMKKPQ